MLPSSAQARQVRVGVPSAWERYLKRRALVPLLAHCGIVVRHGRSALAATSESIIRSVGTSSQPQSPVSPAGVCADFTASLLQTQKAEGGRLRRAENLHTHHVSVSLAGSRFRFSQPADNPPGPHGLPMRRCHPRISRLRTAKNPCWKGVRWRGCGLGGPGCDLAACGCPHGPRDRMRAGSPASSNRTVPEKSCRSLRLHIGRQSVRMRLVNCAACGRCREWCLRVPSRFLKGRR